MVIAAFPWSTFQGNQFFSSNGTSFEWSKLFWKVSFLARGAFVSFPSHSWLRGGLIINVPRPVRHVTLSPPTYSRKNHPWQRKILTQDKKNIPWHEIIVMTNNPMERLLLCKIGWESGKPTSNTCKPKPTKWGTIVGRTIFGGGALVKLTFFVLA